MFHSFKSLELFRHQVSSRVDKSLKQYADESKNSAEKISSTVFSACFSLVITFLSHTSIEQNQTVKTIITFALFVVTYIAAYFMYKRVTRKFEQISYNRKHHGTTLSGKAIKDIIDNFDHIACDHNLVGKEFIKSYKREKDLDLREFYFHELYYYIKTSADITLLVLNHSNCCVNTLEQSSRVALHRIYNQLNMMKDAKEFLLENIIDSNIIAHKNLKLVVISEIEELSSNLKEIEGKCDILRNKYFSDKQVGLLIDKHKDMFHPENP